MTTTRSASSSRALAREGFRVSVAADGRAMRQVLADSRIDLILLDLMMTGEDGLSLCRSLRAQSNIPIIMLTAKGDEVDRGSIPGAPENPDHRC